MIWARETQPIAMTGSTLELRCSLPLVGNQPSFTENTSMRMTASQNPGTDNPSMAKDCRLAP